MFFCRLRADLQVSLADAMGSRRGKREVEVVGEEEDLGVIMQRCSDSGAGDFERLQSSAVQTFLLLY